MLHTDDLIRDTEKNIVRGYSDDFTDLYKYAYEKGKVEAIEECISTLKESYPLIDSYGFSCAIHRLEQLKERE